MSRDDRRDFRVEDEADQLAQEESEGTAPEFSPDGAGLETALFPSVRMTPEEEDEIDENERVQPSMERSAMDREAPALQPGDSTKSSTASAAISSEENTNARLQRTTAAELNALAQTGRLVSAKVITSEVPVSRITNMLLTEADRSKLYHWALLLHFRVSKSQQQQQATCKKMRRQQQDSKVGERRSSKTAGSSTTSQHFSGGNIAKRRTSLFPSPTWSIASGSPELSGSAAATEERSSDSPPAAIEKKENIPSGKSWSVDEIVEEFEKFAVDPATSELVALKQEEHQLQQRARSGSMCSTAVPESRRGSLTRTDSRRGSFTTGPGSSGPLLPSSSFVSPAPTPRTQRGPTTGFLSSRPPLLEFEFSEYEKIDEQNYCGASSVTSSRPRSSERSRSPSPGVGLEHCSSKGSKRGMEASPRELSSPFGKPYAGPAGTSVQSPEGTDSEVSSAWMMVQGENDAEGAGTTTGLECPLSHGGSIRTKAASSSVFMNCDEPGRTNGGPSTTSLEKDPSTPSCRSEQTTSLTMIDVLVRIERLASGKVVILKLKPENDDKTSSSQQQYDHDDDVLQEESQSSTVKAELRPPLEEHVLVDADEETPIGWEAPAPEGIALDTHKFAQWVFEETEVAGFMDKEVLLHGSGSEQPAQGRGQEPGVQASEQEAHFDPIGAEGSPGPRVSRGQHDHQGSAATTSSQPRVPFLPDLPFSARIWTERVNSAPGVTSSAIRMSNSEDTVGAEYGATDDEGALNNEDHASCTSNPTINTSGESDTRQTGAEGSAVQRPAALAENRETDFVLPSCNQQQQSIGERIGDGAVTGGESLALLATASARSTGACACGDNGPPFQTSRTTSAQKKYHIALNSCQHLVFRFFRDVLELRSAGRKHFCTVPARGSSLADMPGAGLLERYRFLSACGGSDCGEESESAVRGEPQDEAGAPLQLQPDMPCACRGCRGGGYKKTYDFDASGGEAGSSFAITCCRSRTRSAKIAVVRHRRSSAPRNPHQRHRSDKTQMQAASSPTSPSADEEEEAIEETFLQDRSRSSHEDGRHFDAPATGTDIPGAPAGLAMDADEQLPDDPKHTRGSDGSPSTCGEETTLMVQCEPEVLSWNPLAWSMGVALPNEWRKSADVERRQCNEDFERFQFLISNAIKDFRDPPLFHTDVVLADGTRATAKTQKGLLLL
ncbi:unnamed protein product [Amoebophrya sp. A25]|nr:unnamed protein product [Amoebophrya sp. A25]|eukprot:GSA25T00004398001.1